MNGGLDAAQMEKTWNYSPSHIILVLFFPACGAVEVVSAACCSPECIWVLGAL